MKQATRLVGWTAQEAGARVDDLLAVYADAMRYRPESLSARREYLTGHLHQSGFRAVATLTPDGTLVGFGYGYRSARGQWWHDQVAAALDRPTRATWLADCFEVVELHVRTEAQSRGLGAAQLRALLAGATGATTVLSTPEVAAGTEGSSRPWRLYRRFGYVDLVRHLIFPGDTRAFAVLGRALPLDR